MNTTEAAEKFYEYMQQGAFEKIYSELYSEDATSEEAPGSDWPKVKGMAAIREKGKKWNDMVEEMQGGTTDKPVVAGNCFSVFMTMDFIRKGGEKVHIDEIGMYCVKDGKIISEQFFY